MQRAENRNVRLTEDERHAMLAVLDGYQPHEIITTALHFLDLHMPRRYLLPALRWLIANKLTGKRCADFIALDCEMRYLLFQKKLLVAIHRDRQLEIVAGRNFQL